ncbi:MAG: hypothetical protein MJ092_05780 [Lachnospiraceae bacterium]|nr:hypothetical protein [Lachnospiraceae bacterium]
MDNKELKNNEENRKKKKLIPIIIILLAVLVATGIVLAVTLPKKTKPVVEGSGMVSVSGKVTAPKVPTKDAKKEIESKKDAATDKEAKSDDKTNSKQESNASGNTSSNVNSSQGQIANNKPAGNNTTGGNTTGTGTQGGNTSGGSNPASHTHSWQQKYKTVTHPAETEDVWVEDEAAWDEPEYDYHTVCNCGFDFTAAGYSNADIVSHSDYHMDRAESDQYGLLQVQVGTIHHDAVGHYESRVIKTAWSEQVIDHYECSCGATK